MEGEAKGDEGRGRGGRRGGCACAKGPTRRTGRRKKEGEKKRGGREKRGGERVGVVRPASNKLVIIFSQYLSWIGCYFIIFYCLLLLLLPARNPSLAPSQPLADQYYRNYPSLPPRGPVASQSLCFIISSLSPCRGNSLAELIIEEFILL